VPSHQIIFRWFHGKPEALITVVPLDRETDQAAVQRSGTSATGNIRMACGDIVKNIVIFRKPFSEKCEKWLSLLVGAAGLEPATR
jgi:hypothetical protein